MKVVFCIPGREFSNRFLKSWTKLIQELDKNQIDYELICEYAPNIYQIRQILLGGYQQAGNTQHPWQGTKDYDYIMWIDSDQVFEPSDFFKLLEHEKDIVSALIYKKPKSDNMHDLPIQFACNITPDRQMFSNEATGELIKVWTNGMGWMLVKKGVFEKVDYPWFYPIYTSDGIGMHGEDISFQIRAKEAGFDSFVDTSIIVGHEKNVVLI